jgi:hypothetical protein
MNLRFLLLATILGLAACATSGPEPSEQAVKTTSADNVVVENGAAENEGSLEVAEVPEVPVAATALTSENEVVCRREKRLGSNRTIKICRTRAQMNEEREAAQDTLDDLSRRTLGGADRGAGSGE